MADAIDDFRAELRRWLEQHLSPELRPEELARASEPERIERLRKWQATLAKDRWVGITWPREHGGRDASIAEQIVYTEEMTRAQAPPVVGSLGIGIAGPPLIAFGTAEQKERFTHRILSARDVWCFGFSEPGAGSDLASLRTTATLDGDTFVVNGQKVWTTLAHHADWCMLLARTNPGEKRAKGVSCLLVDMKSPGVSVKPLRQMTGEAEFNEIFFDNVRVPRANLLGEIDGGWQVAVAALQNERGILYVVEMRIQLQQARDQLLALAREHGAGNDAVLRQSVAEIHVSTEVFRMTCQRILSKLLRMGMPGPEASIIKLHWTEITQGIPMLGMKILGPEALLYDAPDARAGRADPSQWLQRSYLASRAASIASGTSEIMRGIIAMQVLGLPRG